MRFYRITATNGLKDEDLKEKKVWVTTQGDAASTRKALIDEGFRRKDLETEEVDVPTDKAGLLEWLNQNAV